MGERGQGRDESGLMVKRQLWRAGERTDTAALCLSWQQLSATLFPTDVATSGLTLLYSPSVL